MLDKKIVEKEVYWTTYFFTSHEEDWPCQEYQMDKNHLEVLLNPKRFLLMTQIKEDILLSLLKKQVSFQKVNKMLTFILLWKYSGIHVASEKASNILVSHANVQQDIVDSLAKSYQVEEKGGGSYLLPRPFHYGNKVLVQRLILIDKKSR